MESDFQHHILIVERDEKTTQAIGDILNTESLSTTFAPTGEAALEIIKKAESTFSMIISAQGLDGMQGTTFLEQAKDLSPDSIRFLMAIYSEVELIINAVNQSAVHRFMIKPFEKEDFAKAVHSGLNLYHSFYEHERLQRLAKKQNSKLYELNCDLMEATKSHNQTLHKLDREIKELNQKIALFASKNQESASGVVSAITDQATIDDGTIVAAKVEALFSDTLITLYDEFYDLAQRNGFEMPALDGD